MTNSKRCCSIVSVENCLIQVTYFFRSLALNKKKIIYKGVVFENSRCVMETFKIGYKIDDGIVKSPTLNDLIQALKEIMDLLPYFSNKNIGENL
jgi:hypothetical protein